MHDDARCYKSKLVSAYLKNQNVKISQYSRLRLIGLPVNRVSRLIGPNCEERNPIKENTLRYIRTIGQLFRLIGPQL